MTDAWRFIDTGPCSAAYNMALDEAITIAVRKDSVPPTLRLYRWDVPSVSIGCFQKTSDVDVEYCIEKHFPIVRRPTGGRAILHTNELTYSFSVKTTSEPFSKGLFDSYKRISSAFAHALSKIGLPPELKLQRETRRSPRHVKNPLCFQSTSYGEISVSNNKVVGSAQKRWTDGLLQQGSIPYSIDKEEMFKVFRLESGQMSGKLIIGLKDIFPELNPDDFKNIIRLSFEETFNTGLILLSPLKEEVSLAKELETQKYLSHEWNFKR
jgi:lipoate-protein ligase A